MPLKDYEFETEDKCWRSGIQKTKSEWYECYLLEDWMQHPLSLEKWSVSISSTQNTPSFLLRSLCFRNIHQSYSSLLHRGCTVTTTERNRRIYLHRQTTNFNIHEIMQYNNWTYTVFSDVAKLCAEGLVRLANASSVQSSIDYALGYLTVPCSGIQLIIGIIWIVSLASFKFPLRSICIGYTIADGIESIGKAFISHPTDIGVT